MPAILANATSFAYNSDYRTDEIVVAAHGTWSLANSPGTTYVLTLDVNGTDGQPIALTKALIPTGIYSYDGGATWNNLGNSVGFFNASNLAVVTFLESNPDGTISINAEQTAALSNPWRFDVKVALAQRPTDNESLQKRQNSLISSLLFNTDLSYLKIAQQGSYTATGGHVETIQHNLGYVPLVRVFIESGHFGYIDPLPFSFDDFGTSDSGVEVTTSNIVIHNYSYSYFDGVGFVTDTMTIHYVIYYEA